MRIILLFAFCFSFQQLFSQGILTIVSADQPPYNVNTLINNYFAGSGIEVQDAFFHGLAESVGFFSDGTEAIGLDRGILLTNGRATTKNDLIGADLLGMDLACTINGSNVTNPILSGLTTAPLFDVAYYNIQFKPSSDSIRFRYVFATEEFPQYVCSGSRDVFGFFLTGPRPGSTNTYFYDNIALIPGTNLPVSISNNPTYPSYCFELVGQYFHDNTDSGNEPTYNGFTDPFVAEAAVVPGATYYLTLAIADVGDNGLYDSGIFLEGNSFSSAINVGTSFSLSENVIPENAEGNPIAITLSDIPASVLPITISIGGNAENGLDYEMINTQYTITTADTTLYLVFQPIQDTLTEGMETVLLNVMRAGSQVQQFTLYISDPDSSMLQGSNEQIYALSNGPVHLEAYPTAAASSEYTFSNQDDVAIYVSLATSAVEVNLPVSTLTDIHMIKSVCLDIAHGSDDDLDIFLIAPDNRFVELSTDNGGNGDNYTGTCFSPNATDAIIYYPASPPFTGTFQAEGKWEDIQNTPVNGTWKLRVYDDDNLYNYGTLLDWSITFSGAAIGQFKYLWSTGDTTATINVTEAGTYTVSITNAVSHQVRTFVVMDECPHSQITPQVCAGEQYVVGNITFDAEHPSGTVVFDLNGSGCDSTVFVQLDILPQASDSIFAAITTGDTLFLADQAFTETGAYTLQLTTANGCDSLLYLQLDVTTSTKVPHKGSFVMQPNPAHDQVSLSWDKEMVVSSIRLFDRSGKLVQERRVSANAQQENLDISALAAGTYWLSMETAGGVVVRKLLKG